MVLNRDTILSREDLHSWPERDEVYRTEKELRLYLLHSCICTTNTRHGCTKKPKFVQYYYKIIIVSNTTMNSTNEISGCTQWRTSYKQIQRQIYSYSSRVIISGGKFPVAVFAEVTACGFRGKNLSKSSWRFFLSGEMRVVLTRFAAIGFVVGKAMLGGGFVRLLSPRSNNMGRSGLGFLSATIPKTH